jgi:cell wall-associated NlpC family hydrolase
MIKKRITAAIVTLMLVVSVFSPLLTVNTFAVSKSELNSLKQQQQELATKKSEISAKAGELSKQVGAQTEKLRVLNENLELTNEQLKNLSQQIAIYTNSIAEMENKLNEYRQQEQVLLKRYRVRVRAMEENGKIPYYATLLEATSFEDLLSRIDDIREIMEYDSKLISDVKAAQVKVEKAREDMEAEMEAQKKVYAEYQAKQADLTAQQKEAQAVLASLNSKSAEYADQLASVKQLQDSIGRQVASMQSQLDEQKRIEAEENSAKNEAGTTWYGDSSGSATGQQIVNYAEQFLGVSYVYGGTSPSGFDCSGLVYYCYSHYGYRINRTAAGLSYNGVSVSSSNLQPGDVVLFNDGSGSYIGHCGIYIGGGSFIHAPHTGDVVKISSLSSSYYASHYAGARRIV